ncbi:MAG TPA: DivIVA domain-containing protein [Actinomycetales bacterium]|nr:DivIVA domain-containing protein [Actinomycetales bacterium]
MAEMFRTVGRVRKGYSPEEVNEFFAHAREIFEGARPGTMSPSQVQRTSFALVRGGYAPDAVDAAMDRIAQAFADLEREQFIPQYGEQAWITHLTEQAQTLYPRLARPAGERFAPPGRGKRGYDRDEVDDMCDRLIGYFDHGEPLSADAVRSASFTSRRKKNGYDEGSVDAFLARAVAIILAVG